MFSVQTLGLLTQQHCVICTVLLWTCQFVQFDTVYAERTSTKCIRTLLLGVRPTDSVYRPTVYVFCDHVRLALVPNSIVE